MVTPKVCSLLGDLEVVLYQSTRIRCVFKPCFSLRQLVNKLTFYFT